ncbi:nuclear transport factor 2 family protein [Pedobacter gandavensis]|uniref:nuclear transport factor 2 family protein n=1 Tax=Pedobacter gandavensis TaxID=2679963 RepID=UPI00247B0D17|nr:nuclear transport factor 2 family protein [Pedobacter gandavensis]WGQ10723.1 nuclear transport factor 2 family protein [Pedobacter gandavensis]
MENKLTENCILEQENNLYSAIKDSNITMLEKLLHDDLLFILPSGETIAKEKDNDTYRDGALKVDELLPEVEKLNIIDDASDHKFERKV